MEDGKGIVAGEAYLWRVAARQFKTDNDELRESSAQFAARAERIARASMISMGGPKAHPFASVLFILWRCSCFRASQSSILEAVP